MSTPDDELARAVELLAARRGWTTNAELHRQSGVALTTLQRIATGNGARKDTLAKLDTAFDLTPGTMASIARGDRTAEDVITEASAPRPATQTLEPYAAGRTGLDDGQEIVSAGVAEIARQLADQEETVRKVLVNKLRSAGIQPLWPAPTHPDYYDLAYRDDDGLLHAIEVKIAGEGSVNVFGGMGQLIALRHELDEEVRLLLVLERTPTEEEREVLEAQGIEVASLDDWSAVAGAREHANGD